jgi:hypothetical protein
MAPGKVNVRPFRTNGSCGAYLTCIKLKSYTSAVSRIIAIRILQNSKATICMAIRPDFLWLSYSQWQRYEFLHNNMVLQKSKVNLRKKDDEGIYMEVTQLNFSL